MWYATQASNTHNQQFHKFTWLLIARAYWPSAGRELATSNTTLEDEMLVVGGNMSWLVTVMYLSAPATPTAVCNGCLSRWIVPEDHRLFVWWSAERRECIHLFFLEACWAKTSSATASTSRRAGKTSTSAIRTLSFFSVVCYGAVSW